MGKKLIDEKILNTILKAIEVHVSLLENGNVYVNDPVTKEKLVNSIEYLKDIPNMFNSTDSQIKSLKRRAYTRFVEAKKKLGVAMQSGDSNLINECENEKKIALDYYVQLKNVYDAMTNNEGTKEAIDS